MYVINRLVSKNPQKYVVTLSSIFHTKYLQYVHSKISKRICILLRGILMMRYTDHSIYYLFYDCFGHPNWNFLRTVYLDSVLEKIFLGHISTFCKLFSQMRMKRLKKSKNVYKCVLVFNFASVSGSGLLIFPKKVKIVLD